MTRDIMTRADARRYYWRAALAVFLAALAWLLGTCGLLHDLDKPGIGPEDREQIERAAEAHN